MSWKSPSMMFAALAVSLVGGQLLTRTGHYRAFPIVGTALGALGLGVMALLPVGLPLWVPMVVMAVVGLGTGAFMSLIVAVVQSAAPHSELGSVTAAVNLVRSVGSTVATAVIGGVIGFGVAALLGGGGFEPLFASHYVATQMTAEVARLAWLPPLPPGAREGSLWLRRQG